jgi:hypothetical protein
MAKARQRSTPRKKKPPPPDTAVEPPPQRILRYKLSAEELAALKRRQAEHVDRAKIDEALRAMAPKRERAAPAPGAAKPLPATKPSRMHFRIWTAINTARALYAEKFVWTSLRALLTEIHKRTDDKTLTEDALRKIVLPYLRRGQHAPGW